MRVVQLKVQYFSLIAYYPLEPFCQIFLCKQVSNQQNLGIIICSLNANVYEIYVIEKVLDFEVTWPKQQIKLMPYILLFLSFNDAYPSRAPSRFQAAFPLHYSNAWEAINWVLFYVLLANNSYILQHTSVVVQYSSVVWNYCCLKLLLYQVAIFVFYKLLKMEIFAIWYFDRINRTLRW